MFFGFASKLVRFGFVTKLLRLGGNLEPGHYYLQLEITDKAVKDKEQPPVIQWIDFEIVK